jgi:hypothetical protein
MLKPSDPRLCVLVSRLSARVDADATCRKENIEKAAKKVEAEKKAEEKKKM